MVDDILIIKLDSFGCLQPGCGDLIAVPTDNIFEQKEIHSFTLSPNPTSGRLILKTESPLTDSGKVVFYNEQGQKVHEQAIEKGRIEVAIDLTGKASGAYFAVFKTKKGVIDVGKIILK